MATVLVNGKIVTPTETINCNLKIENNIISEIGNSFPISEDDKVIDVEGSYILPGAIDTHTHLDLDTGFTKTADDFKTGTLAAIYGGTTTILDFATQDKGKTLEDGLKVWHEKAAGNSFCDYGFHMAITDWNETTSKSMQKMVDEGVSSFKMYMAYKGTLQVNDDDIYEALKRSKEVKGIIGFHCENGDIIDELIKENIENKNIAPMYHEKSRPAILEEEAISRVTKIGHVTKSPLYIVHLSTKGGYEEALRAREGGCEVYLETCPQYLLLDKSCYKELKEDSFNGAKYVMSPPLREQKDIEALWKGLFNNIEIIGTDHCSFNYKGQKSFGRNDFSKIPNGGPGVEHRLLLMYQYGVIDKKFSINKMSELVSTNAAKMFGMYPNKGIVKEGSIADLVILNPNKEFEISSVTQHQNVDYTPYEGIKINASIDHVFLNGKHVICDGNLEYEKPLGQFVKREPFKGLNY